MLDGVILLLQLEDLLVLGGDLLVQGLFFLEELEVLHGEAGERLVLVLDSSLKGVDAPLQMLF